MRRSRYALGIEGFGMAACCALIFAAVGSAAAQNPDALSPFFEGKQIVVKMDMPGTQKGVDIYPDRTPTLDAKSYGDRMKQFGVALRNGDTVMVTKVKVNKDNVEFQLGGGGFGTAMDNSDTSIHFTPADKSAREKELENQLNNETDPDRRRSLQRELDRVRADRERRDDDAAIRTQAVAVKRQQGGSRFNIRLDAKKMGDSLTPQVIQNALAQYVAFPGDASGAGGAPVPTPTGAPALVERSPVERGGDPAQGGLRKGMTREQVEALYGPAAEANDHTDGGLTITTCVFKAKDVRVQADFVNGVMIRFLLSSY
jgi:hypothetical protein